MVVMSRFQGLLDAYLVMEFSPKTDACIDGFTAGDNREKRQQSPSLKARWI